MLNSADGVNLDEKPTLFMEFHAAHEATLEAGLDMVKEMCDDLGAVSFRATMDASERKKLWHARHHSYEILVRTNPGKKFFIGDVAVPISAYPELIGYIECRRRWNWAGRRQANTASASASSAIWRRSMARRWT
jgi:D-lactate dehydrogenase (cytochrome)